MDLTIPVTGATVTMIGVAIVGYFCKDKLEEIRARREAFLLHIKMCNERSITFALLEKKVTDLATQVEIDRNVRHWIGDCIQNIAGHLDVKLPPRPRLDS